MAATKCDVLTRKVQEKEGRDWAAAHGFQLFEVRKMLEGSARGSCCFEQQRAALAMPLQTVCPRHLSLPLIIQMRPCRPCNGARACPLPKC